jgi:cytidylate kinase
LRRNLPVRNMDTRERRHRRRITLDRECKIIRASKQPRAPIIERRIAMYIPRDGRAVRTVLRAPTSLRLGRMAKRETQVIRRILVVRQ